MSNQIKVMGIDPGSLYTGFGLLECDLVTQQVAVIQAGLILLKPSGSTSSLVTKHNGIKGLSLIERLGGLQKSFCEIVERYRPDWVVVEKIFLSKSPQSAFVLGHARGVILSIVGAYGLNFAEYSAREVKKSLTGYGGASKEQVARVLSQRLQVPPQNQWDSSDALALGWHHVMVLLEKEKWKRASLKL
ncbi:MAG: crossover junction endodeoxyribonuclease RuvC [Bdellovibrionaceae bacterium]|nr:crossover junction endodeoxyribonuclease RuvC [Pseudobdellovibrionaceae bacterium]MDW8190325.1 crossover junction endodeoxyribonuclease RuvC [Pseudobdellovibrionaceae bacterium]